MSIPAIGPMDPSKLVQILQQLKAGSNDDSQSAGGINGGQQSSGQSPVNFEDIMQALQKAGVIPDQTKPS